MAKADDIAATLEAAFGKNDESATVKTWLSTGYPELDYALSSKWDGGLAVGRIVEISGPPSSGKTAITTWAMMRAQMLGGVAGFFDHERSFSETLARKLGLNTAPGRWIYRKPRTFEESVSLCVQICTMIREKKLIPADAPICWGFDSLAQMVPQSVLYDQKTGALRDPKTRNMNDNTALARATSAHMPAFELFCEELGICAIIINQIRTKIGVVYGDPRTTPGGDAPKFAASQRIMLGSSMLRVASGPKKGEVLGSEITAQIIKNKVARPYLSAKFRFMFQEDGTGKFDIYRSLVDFLMREKTFAMAGNYIEWEGGKHYPDALSKKLEAAGDWSKLMDLLPKKFEPVMDPTAMMLGADEKEPPKSKAVAEDGTATDEEAVA